MRKTITERKLEIAMDALTQLAESRGANYDLSTRADLAVRQIAELDGPQYLLRINGKETMVTRQEFYGWMEQALKDRNPFKASYQGHMVIGEYDD